jgi:hypothetical protein
MPCAAASWLCFVPAWTARAAIVQLDGLPERKIESLTALRGTGSEKVQVLSYAYYLAFTATANDPVPPSRDRMLRRGCDGPRAEKGSLNLADDTAKGEIEAKMEALQIGKPWFGPVVAQDENGCYHIILYKHPDYLGVEHREALLTIITYVKRRQVTYTRAMPYFSAWLPTFVRWCSPRWRRSSK